MPVHYEDADSALFKFGDTLVNLLNATEAAERIELEPVAPPNAGSRFQLTILSEPGVAPVGPTDTQQEFVVRIYLAGPVFTTPEREWNVGLAARLRAGGHEVFVPQDHPAAERTGRAIFRKDLEGLDWADTVVAIMDGADPDSGTCWECGYAYARGKTVVLFRSDIRGSGDERDIPYNAMLIGAADAHIEQELATLDEAAAAILTTLAGQSKA